MVQVGLQGEIWVTLTISDTDSRSFPNGKSLGEKGGNGKPYGSQRRKERGFSWEGRKASEKCWGQQIRPACGGADRGQVGRRVKRPNFSKRKWGGGGVEGFVWGGHKSRKTTLKKKGTRKKKKRVL